MKVETICIEGMSCSHCQKAVSNAIRSLSGVKEVEVSLESKNAVVTFDDAVLSLTAIKAAVEDEGYCIV